MSKNEATVLRALSTDLNAALELRRASFQCAAMHQWESANAVPSAGFAAEYAAVEEFVDNNFNMAGMVRFCPVI
jgi:hypothetical protein